MSLFVELQRRNVLRVATAYVAVSWLVVQVVETLFPLFGLGDTAIRTVVIVLVAGFVPALILSWAFEWTPEGFRRDEEVDRTSPFSRRMAKRLDRAVMVMLALAVGYFAFDKFVLAPEREAEVADEARQAGRTEAIVESFSDKSIAVLPCADMSPGGDQGYFSDGIAEELLNLLARIDDLRVVSRSSSFALRNENLSTPGIAAKLNVGYVLECSVRRAGDMLRITAQLIEGRSDTHLWSRTYDRTLDNIFAIQDEISAQVVDELKLELLGPASSLNPTDPEVFDLLLRGRHALAGRALAEAERFFEQAIAIDPDYAPAHAGLAKALLLQVAYQQADLAPTRARAEEAVDRALQLDPQNPDALAAKGFMHQGSDVKAARDWYERAIAVNPANSDAYRWLAQSYSRSAEPARYLEYARRGQLADPLNPGINYNLVLALMRFARYDEALAAARAWHDVDPGLGPYRAAQKIHLASGDLIKSLKTLYAVHRLYSSPNIEVGWVLFDEMLELELAEAWMQDAGDANRDNPGAVFLSIALTYMKAEQDRALRLLAEAETRHPEWWYVVGRSYVVVGRDFERAMEVWERGRLESGQSEPSTWEPSSIVDYALALQRTGAPERAGGLIDETLARIQAQAAGGLVGDIDGVKRLVFYTAVLYSLRGDTPRMLAALRTDDRMPGGSCYSCLRGWPHFDYLQGNPEFEALKAEQDAQVAAVRQQLLDEGMLLTPSEVLALEDFDFDPFEP